MMKVCIIGDIIVDNYIYGTAERLSPEAPIPIVKCQSATEKLGGAGNLYENLLSLGVDVDLLDLSEPRCVKTRVFCDGHYVTRIDEDEMTDGSKVLDTIRELDFSDYEYVILSDYGKGVLEYSASIIEHVNEFGCKVIVDPKNHYWFYEGAWLVKPNSAEFTKYEFDSWQGNIIVTDSSNVVTADIDGKFYQSFVDKVEVSDVTGAGDSFLAAFVYGLTMEYDYQKCLDIATKAATHSVKHIGTYTLKPTDVEEIVVFTNGCFDILHRGHIEYLEASKALGTRLVVGLNSDASVKRLKGDSRPIHTQEDRKKSLEALSCVDEVIVFDDDTPYDLIKDIRPNIITKGGDYTKDNVVGNDLAQVVILPYKEGYSTTEILEKL